MNRFLPLSSRNCRSLLSLKHRQSACRRKTVRSLWDILLLLLTLTACEHRPLVDLNNLHYIRVYLDEDIRNLTYGFYAEERVRPQYVRPTVLRATLCDPTTGYVVADRYLQNSGQDERGHYLDGYITAEPGRYKLMVYAIATEATSLRDEQNYFDIQAYTHPISPFLYTKLPQSRLLYDENLIDYAPDHLFVVAQEDLQVAYVETMDTLRNEAGDYFTAQSVVETYYLQVHIKGLKYVSSASSLLTGMAGSKTLCNNEMNTQDPAIVFFEMLTAEENPEEDRAIIYATFNTFGKLPDEASLYEVTFEFLTLDGRSQTETIDITPMFDTEQVKVNRWILLEHVIEVKPPASLDDGLDPGVEEWDDVETDVII
ncbi:MAG: DUF5119 domain-containing protein [Bacteroides sp.]|nr:DUF5119 domain-containing protein [Bacteroides sp.]